MPDTIELQRINSALQVLVQQMAKIAYALETIAHVQNPSCIFLPLSRDRQIRVLQDFAGQNSELRLQYGG
jgi:hypothetical protein